MSYSFQMSTLVKGFICRNMVCLTEQTHLWRRVLLFLYCYKIVYFNCWCEAIQYMYIYCNTFVVCSLKMACWTFFWLVQLACRTFFWLVQRVVIPSLSFILFPLWIRIRILHYIRFKETSLMGIGAYPDPHITLTVSSLFPFRRLVKDRKTHKPLYAAAAALQYSRCSI